MIKEKTSLTGNLIYNISYQILSMIVPLITAPYISRVLGASGFGEYSYTYSIAHYFVLVMMLGVLNYGNREIARVKDNQELLNKTFWNIYSVQFYIGVLVTIIYFTYIVTLCENYKVVFCAQGLYVISGVIDISWFYFGIEKFKITTKISAVNKILTTILLFIFVKSSEDVYIYTIIIAINVLLNNLLYWILLRKFIVFEIPSISACKKHLKPLVILFVPVIAVSIYKYMDKIMLGTMVGTSEVGIYEAAEKFVNLPLSIITAFGTVMLPRVSNLKEKSDEKSVKKYNSISMIIIMFIGFGITFGLAGISNLLMPWFYGEDFIKSSNVLTVLLPSVIFVCWANVVRTQCLLPNKRDKEYCISVLGGAAINFIVNFICIPIYGAVGAAVGTTIAELSVCFVQCIETKNDMDFKSYILNSIPFFINGFIMYLFIIRINMVSNVLTIILRIIVGMILYLVLSGWYLYKNLKKPKF